MGLDVSGVISHFVKLKSRCFPFASKQEKHVEATANVSSDASDLVLL